MQSMTGYGRSQISDADCQITVEIHAVNKKQLEIVLNLPPTAVSMEPQVRSLIDQSIRRGRITVTVSLNLVGKQTEPVINQNLALSYLQKFRQLQRNLELPGDITIDTILRSPGVMQNPSVREPSAEVLRLMVHTVGQALLALVEMRSREGASLAEDLRTHLAHLRSYLSAIRQRQPESLARFKSILSERIANSGFDLSLDQDRLNREIVFFADRSDHSEELVRLESHLDQFAFTCRQNEAIGRTLEFLCQEMTRELNTVSAKANDAPVSHLVVQCKSEIEKIREQVQNIE